MSEIVLSYVFLGRNWPKDWTQLLLHSSLYFRCCIFYFNFNEQMNRHHFIRHLLNVYIDSNSYAISVRIAASKKEFIYNPPSTTVCDES